MRGDGGGYSDVQDQFTINEFENQNLKLKQILAGKYEVNFQIILALR